MPVTVHPAPANGTSQAGLLADRPAASADNAGRLYFATDVNGGTLYRSNGSSWVQVAPQVDLTTLGLFAPKTAFKSDSATFVSCPGKQLTGSFDARIKYSLDVRPPSANTQFFGEYSTPSQMSWRLVHRADNTLQVGLSADGTTAVTVNMFAVIPFAADGFATIRVTFDAPTSTVTMFSSDDDGVTWAEVASVVTTISSLFASTSPLGVLRTHLGGGVAGAVEWAELYDGIDGVLVAEYDGRAPMLPYRDSAGNLWTLSGTGNSWIRRV